MVGLHSVIINKIALQSRADIDSRHSSLPPAAYLVQNPCRPSYAKILPELTADGSSNPAMTVGESRCLLTDDEVHCFLCTAQLAAAAGIFINTVDLLVSSASRGTAQPASDNAS